MIGSLRRVGSVFSALPHQVRPALARLGGSDGIAMSPDAGTRRCVITGSLIVLVATIAALAATFSIVILAGAPMGVAVLIGLLFGLIICLWDQGLVASAARAEERRRPLLATLVRVGGAGLIGAMIWASAMIYFFEADIDIEMDRLRLEQLEDSERFRQIPDLEATRDGHLAMIANPVTRAVADDRGVQLLTDQLTESERFYREAQQAIVIELEGNSASRRSGPGPATAEKERIRDERRSERDTAQAQLDAASAEVANDIRRGSLAVIATAAGDLGRVNAELARLRGEKGTAEAMAVAANNSTNSKGLPGLEAVGRLAEDRPTSVLVGVLAYLGLTGLFLPPVLITRALTPPQRYLRQ